MDSVYPSKPAFDSFLRSYYAIRDDMRFCLDSLYHTFAIIEWNGTLVHGNDDILEHGSALPPQTHKIVSVDCLHIPYFKNTSLRVYHVKIKGDVVFNGGEVRQFNQNFLMSIEFNDWKIVVEYYKDSE